MPADAPIGPPPPGPLISNLLRMNTRLQACAQYDASHVTPQEPASDHVRLIQEALNTVANAGITGEAGYGPKTAAAVIAFKRSRNPPLYTRGTSSIDAITGTGTIRALDAELAKKDPPKDDPNKKKGGGGAGVLPVFNPTGQCHEIWLRPDDLNAGDLQFGQGSRAVKTAVTGGMIQPLHILPDGVLLAVVSAGVTGMSGGGSLSKAPDPRLAMEPPKLLARFATGAGSGDWVWQPGSAVSNFAPEAPGIALFVELNVRSRIRNAIREGWKAGRIDEAAIARSIKGEIEESERKKPEDRVATPPLKGALAGFIGGTQGFRFELCDLSIDRKAQTFTYAIGAEFFDHFGVDDTDVRRKDHFNPAASAFLAHWFVLQHFRSSGLTKQFRPFRTVVRTRFGPFTDRST